MYVTKLDRHWLESPFLFQGFYVESDDQIDKLKTTCKYVYVDGGHQEQIYDPKESAFQGGISINTTGNPRQALNNRPQGKNCSLRPLSFPINC